MSKIRLDIDLIVGAKEADYRPMGDVVIRGSLVQNGKKVGKPGIFAMMSVRDELLDELRSNYSHRLGVITMDLYNSISSENTIVTDEMVRFRFPDRKHVAGSSSVSQIANFLRNMKPKNGAVGDYDIYENAFNESALEKAGNDAAQPMIDELERHIKESVVEKVKPTIYQIIGNAIKSLPFLR
jgi:hypothetical protein